MVIRARVTNKAGRGQKEVSGKGVLAITQSEGFTNRVALSKYLKKVREEAMWIHGKSTSDEGTWNVKALSYHRKSECTDWI